MPIQNRIAEFQKDMQKWRHHFHEFPELAYKEINTAKKVVELLKKFLKHLTPQIVGFFVLIIIP